jgi:hypothetical protein
MLNVGIGLLILWSLLSLLIAWLALRFAWECGDQTIAASRHAEQQRQEVLRLERLIVLQYDAMVRMGGVLGLEFEAEAAKIKERE